MKWLCLIVLVLCFVTGYGIGWPVVIIAIATLIMFMLPSPNYEGMAKLNARIEKQGPRDPVLGGRNESWYALHEDSSEDEDEIDL